MLFRSKRHGAVVRDTDFFAALTESITRQARLLGYELLITYFYGNQDSAEQLRSLKASPCDGILLLATEMVAADFPPFPQPDRSPRGAGQLFPG